MEINEYELSKAAGVWHERLDAYINQYGEIGKQVVWLFALDYAGQAQKHAAEMMREESKVKRKPIRKKLKRVK